MLSILLLTTTTNQLVPVGGDDRNMKKCLDNEREALLLFKAPLHDPHGRLSTWRADEHDCCNWSGVTCNNQTGHVTMLEIGYRNLEEFGNLTNLQVLYLSNVGRCRVEKVEWLSHLTHLEELDMDGISLAKAEKWVDVILSLPKLSWLSLRRCELSQVMYPYSSSFLNSSSSSSSSFFRLDLGYNNLTSSMYHWLYPLTTNIPISLGLNGNMLDGIPKYFGNLSSLTGLSFADNSVALNFPDFLNNLSLGLRSLFAFKNQFTGSLSDDIQKFSSLRYLDLSHNHLNGSISEKLWELPRLEYLDLSFNNLTVPSTYHLSNISYVKYLDLSSCKLLEPRFPKLIQTLKNLTHLDLSNTGISDTIPLEFWDAWPSQLKYLNLSSNNISGKVPDLLSNFAKDYSEMDLSSNSFNGPIPNVTTTLTSLNLSRNKFTGVISFICQIVDGLLYFLDLSHNSLVGQLPDCLWHFKHLRVLNLGHNNLFGSLPPSIGSMIELKVLYLFKNSFSGELPLSLKNCTSLISLNLGANKFSGTVPVWIGENLSGLYVLILRSNKFIGTIPLQLCQLPNLQVLDLSMNNLHGSIPSCLSNLTSMVQQGGFSQDVQYYRNVTDNIFALETYVDHAMIEWQGDEREFFSTLKLLKTIDLSSNRFADEVEDDDPISNSTNCTQVDLLCLPLH
ncbi:unnamed protein product [Lactuca virosa]|uniref:Leucine-rich repeat-containing N-terminal plant-type domain-containing protein n=1 Tax=Lactuca virosa TaxID=75947 RepID=A0AAU9PRH7_9ASTR|nr:unnamed protein product [Lactuca virosa]